MWQVPGEFHFLRPLWLLALLPCLLLALRFRRARAGSSLWHALIDPALLGVLLLGDASPRGRALPWILFAGWGIAVLALAGPAWERLPQPVHRTKDAVVIALDLGSTMRAADVQPSRYERARFKLADLLARRHDGQTALIVYAGDAHVVTPLSDDAGTLAAMLPALSPDIMPAEGDDLAGAVRLAGSLLSGAGLTEGRLLVITDRFDPSRQAEVAELLRQSGLSLSLLATGTAAGAPVALPGGGFLRNRSGGIVVPGLEIDAMREAVAAAGGRFATLSVDDSDLAYLLPPPLAADIAPQDGGRRTFDQWQDRAPWLAFALLPLAALGFRRGWLLGASLAFTLALPQQRAEALEWQDLWLSKDQQGARALAEGDPARAARLFRSPEWRGAAQYDAGDYGAAARSWAEAEGAATLYNRGNALAHAGRLEDALAAYDAALAREPGMPDARANRELVEQLLRRQREQQQQEQEQRQQRDDAHRQQGGQPSKDQNGDPQPGAQSQDGGPPQGGDPGRKDAQDGGDDGKQPPDADEPRSAEAADRREPDRGADAGDATAAQQRKDGAGPLAGAEQSAAEREQSAAMEQWLRQVPDDPGELLRRKFEYEYRARRGGSSDEGNE